MSAISRTVLREQVKDVLLQRIDRMRVTSIFKHPARGIVLRQRRGDVPHAPRAAQIQPIEMSKLRIQLPLPLSRSLGCWATGVVRAHG